MNLKAHEEAVHSFFSHGSITLHAPDSEVEASVLIVGTREPIKLKIEITHLWGRPLVHILIADQKIRILLFSEKRYYVGDIEDPFIANLLTMPLDTELLWAMGRGFPLLREYHRVTSTDGNQISLMGGEDNLIQHIEFFMQKHLPRQTIYCEYGLEASFSDFETENDIRFARETRFIDQKTGRMLRIKIKQIVFNKAIKDSIFAFTIPKKFKPYKNTPRLDTQ